MAVLDYDKIWDQYGTNVWKGSNRDRSDRYKKFKDINKNPGNYTTKQIEDIWNKSLRINQFDFQRNIGSDDDDYVDDVVSYNAAVAGNRNNLNRLLIESMRSAAPAPAPAPAPTPTKPKEKKAPLTGGRGEDGDNSTSAPVPGSDQDPTRYKGLTAAEYEDFIDKREYEQQIGLANQDSRSRALIQSLRNESAKETASIMSSAQMYGSDRSLDATDLSSRRDKEARMYVADRGKEATLDKAKIDGVFGVKMQNIIARGAEDVEKIRGEYGLSAQRIAGEYGLERDRIQGATARDVANRNRDAQIFSSLMSGFWS